MARVITFSRLFPATHPRKGEPTYFVEKLWNSIHSINGIFSTNYYEIVSLNPSKENDAELFWKKIRADYDTLGEKHHTIRVGKRWKVGDKFSPRVWIGKPYASKMITIAPDIEIKKVWDFEMKPKLFIDECEMYINGERINGESFKTLAQNDGLAAGELLYWFGGSNAMDSKRKPFSGQIICWNENINY
jgi:hypothetical protein